jgi:hypothetical protein
LLPIDGESIVRKQVSMSKHEFTKRYIFNVSPRLIRLSIWLSFVSGGATAALAVIPGAADAVQLGETVGGMTAQTLLGCISVGSLALAGYCVKLLVTQAASASKEREVTSVILAKVGENIESMNAVMLKMECVKAVQK